MPWDSLAAAQKDGMPAELDGAPLTLAQVNRIAEVADALEAAGQVDEPWAVAVAQFKKDHEIKDGAWVAKAVQHADGSETYTTKPKVIFKPGRHQGSLRHLRLYTEADCKEMVKNFEETKDLRKPQVTLGHYPGGERVAHALGMPEDEDGRPSLGEVVQMWWDDERKAVMGIMSGLPKKLADLVRAGKYKKASADVYLEKWDSADERVRKNWIKNVGFLGVQFPGMNNQEDDLAIAFESDDDELVRVAFSDRDDDGGDEVEMKELEAKLAEMETRLGELQAAKDQADELASKMFGLIGEDVGSVEQAEEAIAKMRSEAADAKEKLDLAEKAKREAHEKASKARVDEALAEAVKNEQVLPKNVEAETDVAMSLVGESVRVTFSESDEPDPLDGWLKALKARPKVVRFAEEAAQEGDPPDPEPKRTPEEKRVLDAMGVTPEMEKEAREAGYLRDNE